MQRRSQSTRGAPRSPRPSEKSVQKSEGSNTKLDPGDPDFSPLSRVSRWQVLVALVAFRVSSAVFSQTAFVPDEYWQSLEVAHRMVFGYPTRE